MNSTTLKRSFGLDLLRTIAICLVLLSHSTLLLFPTSENISITIIRVFGAVGVDLFFVLSGFLIGGILLKQIDVNKTGFKDFIVFWKRRWLRTLPNYYLILVVNILIYILLNKNLPSNLWSFVLFLQNFSFPQVDFFTEAWSLSIEEYAYLLLPFVLYSSFLVFRKLNKKKVFFWITLLLIAALLVLKISYYFNVKVSSYVDWSHSFRKVVIYRLDSIYFGFILVYLVKTFPSLFVAYKNQFLIFGILIFTLLHILIFSFNLLPQTHLGFYVFIYLQLVIISIALTFPYFLKLSYTGFLSKTIQLISKLSYSIYLVNYSIVLLNMQRIFEVSHDSILQKISLMICFLGISFFISFLIYKNFELPILKFRDKRYR